MSSGPTTWFSGKSAPEDQRGPSGALIFGTALAIYSPLGAAIAVACYLMFNYYRISHKVILGAAALYCVPYFALVALFSSASATLHDYNAPWRALIAQVRDGHGSLGAWFSGYWWTWVTAQFGLSLACGLIFGASWASWKWIRRPVWEDNERIPGPIHRLRRRKAIADISSGLNGPGDGATVGVDPFGVRIVQTESEAAAHTLSAGASGSGKALDVDTPIPTTTGWKRMGDIEVGDLVFDEQGLPTAVVGAFGVQHDRPCYEVVFSDGSVIVADGDHLWETETIATRQSVNRVRPRAGKRSPVGSPEERAIARAALATAAAGETISIRTIGDVLGWAESRRGTLHKWLNQTAPVAVEPAPAYVAMYGDQRVDRHSGAPTAMFDAATAWQVMVENLDKNLNDQSHLRVPGRIVTTDQIRATLRNKHGKIEHSVRLVRGAVQYPGVDLPFDPYLLGLWLGDGASAGAKFTTAESFLLNRWSDAGYGVKHIAGYDYSISGGLHVTLGELGVRDNKHVPAIYLRASEQDRRALLAGLMDTDGNNEQGPRVSFTNKNIALCEAVYDLAASLGYRPTMRSRFTTLKGKKCGPYGVVSFAAPDDDVFWLPRKRAEQAAARKTANPSRHEQRYILDVRPVESRPVRCIKVASPSSLFLAGKSYIPTHNTTTMMIGIRDAIRRGEPVCVVDLKGGADVPEQLAEWANRYGRRFLHWSILPKNKPYLGPADGPAYYDPIGRGDPSRKKDLIIGAEKWENEYYKSVAENYLQIAFQIGELIPNTELDAFSDLTDLMDPKRLGLRALALFLNAAKTPEGLQAVSLANTKGVPVEWWKFTETVLDPYVREILSVAGTYIIGLEETERSGVRGLAAKIQKLRGSTAGAWLRRDPEHGRDINLRTVADEGWVVVFSLDSSNYEATSSQVGGLIIQDLKTLSSELRNDPAPHPFHIYVDEFSSIGSDNILGLLAKARDARMPCTLSTQALADLKKADPAFLDQALGIVGAFVIHRANTEHDAEIFAGLTGKKMVYVKRYGVEMASGMPGGIGTGSATGQGHIEQQEDYVVVPSAFQALKPGELVYVAKTGTARVVHPVSVIREDPELVARAVAAGTLALPAGPAWQRPEPVAPASPFDTEAVKDVEFPSPWPVMAGPSADVVASGDTGDTGTAGVTPSPNAPLPLREALAAVTPSDEPVEAQLGSAINVPEVDLGQAPIHEPKPANTASAAPVVPAPEPVASGVPAAPGDAPAAAVERKPIIDPAAYRGDLPASPKPVEAVPVAAAPPMPVSVPVPSPASAPVTVLQGGGVDEGDGFAFGGGNVEWETVGASFESDTASAMTRPAPAPSPQPVPASAPRGLPLARPVVPGGDSGTGANLPTTNKQTPEPEMYLKSEWNE